MVTAIILTVIALVLLGASFVFQDQQRTRNAETYTESHAPMRWGLRIGGAVFIVAAALIIVFASFYTQERGQSVIKQDIFGNIKGSTSETGLHGKAPWEKTIRFDTLNQVVEFRTSPTNGEIGNGPHITVTDKNGVSHDVDVTTTYSINPDSVEDIYGRFKDQPTFEQALVYQDVRTVTRNAANQFTTEQLLTEKVAYANAIEEGLRARWEKTGVTVDRVNLQEIRSPQQVKQAFDDAQQAKIEVARQQANLEAAEVQAQQQVAQAEAEAEAKQIMAKGEAEANRTLEASLTDRVLQQRYLDMLSELAAEGNLMIVPADGFNGLVNVKP